MSGVRTDLMRGGSVGVRKTNRRVRVDRDAGGRMFLFTAAALICIVFALAFVWSNHRALNMGYEISALHETQNALLDKNRELKVELANLTALDRLEHLATTELGLVMPRPEQVRVIE
jgi:cell division protein FtsL